MAEYRNIYPAIRVKTVNLYSEQRADVITQVDGIIENLAVAAHEEVAEGQTILHLRNRDVDALTITLLLNLLFQSLQHIQVYLPSQHNPTERVALHQNIIQSLLF